MQNAPGNYYTTLKKIGVWITNRFARICKQEKCKTGDLNEKKKLTDIGFFGFFWNWMLVFLVDIGQIDIVYQSTSDTKIWAAAIAA